VSLWRKSQSLLLEFDRTGEISLVVVKLITRAKESSKCVQLTKTPRVSLWRKSQSLLLDFDRTGEISLVVVKLIKGVKVEAKLM
jgi:hypothetical protein